MPDDPSQEQNPEEVINPERLDQIEEQAEDEEEAETMKMQEMMRQQKKQQEQRENAGQPQAEPAMNDTQIYGQDVDPEEMLEDVPEKKQEKWIDQLVFEGEITEQCEMAGGKIQATFRVRSGDDSLELAEIPKEVQGEDPQATIQYVNTRMSLRRLALVTLKVNGESIGTTVDEREEYFRERPSVFANRLHEEYNDLEMKITAVLQAGDIKN